VTDIPIDVHHEDEDASRWDPDTLPPQRDPDELVLLSNDSIRARRRPWAIAALWGWQAAFAMLVALPISSGVSGIWGSSPDGDAPLWEPGGFDFLHTVFDEHALRSFVPSVFLVILCAAAVLELVPLGALLASIAFVTRARRPPPTAAVVARSWQASPTFAALLGIAALVQLLLVGSAVVMFFAISHGLMDDLGKPRADQIAIVVAGLLGAVTAFVGIVHDLARAAAIRFRVRTVRAIRLAMNTVARGVLPLLWSWGWRAGAGLAPLAVGALVAARLGGRGGSALWALAIVHQLAALARVALRASWLAKAIRAVDHAHRVLRV
jgi:hypothetical protein